VTAPPSGPHPAFHQARWNEPIIFELSRPGQRGIHVPRTEPAMLAALGGDGDGLPAGVRRATPPRLPELSQPHVLRHYLRLSQQTLGSDLMIDVGLGTSTMKYSPKVNDRLVRSAKLADLHPGQPEETVQGVLEIYWRLQRMLCAISGMSGATLQPGGGSAAIWTNVSMVRAYHASRGDTGRDEVVTTLFSHPSNAACAKTAGYRVITIGSGPDGYPDLDALRSAISPRTAALLITNPEDTGLFNPRVRELVDATHQAGGLAVYDQANANGILGITRARDAGFDACQFNLHKTFAVPHGSGGPATGASCVADPLVPFLPVPVVERDGDRYRLDHHRPLSIGKVRPFLGVSQNVVRAYAWIAALGPDGLRQVAESAVLNNNYLRRRILAIPGTSVPFPHGRPLEQVRYSWAGLCADTGLRTEDIGRRVADHGVHYWTSHHPHVVPEPFTVEPSESHSREDLDTYADVLAAVAAEARQNPELVKTAPHRLAVHRTDQSTFDHPTTWAPTWRAHLRKLPPPPT
jgi:glycine dehydrogenase subunit 2